MDSFSSLHEICTQVFDVISKTTSIFILPLFMLRVVFANLLGEGNQAFSILKSTVTYFCLVAAFPLIIEVLFSIPESYLPKYDTINAMGTEAPSWTSSSVIPFAVDRSLEVILAGLYWLVYYLHVFFMILMCSMAPIVFLCSTMLGLGLGIEIFMGLLIIGSSWPIIWYGFDQAHASLVSSQTDEFGGKCLELLLTLFKGVAPVTFASIAIKSPAGRALSRAAQASVTAGSNVLSRAARNPTQKYSSARNNYKASNFEKGRSKSSQRNSTPGNQTGNSGRLTQAKAQQQPKGDRKHENSLPRDL